MKYLRFLNTLTVLGSFGLTFDGFFSQPARYVDKTWKPASDYMLPKDPQMKLSYMEQIANKMMTLKPKELPIVNEYSPCTCRVKYLKRKNVWV